jgi:DNA-directed RNA polymerase specialized sigma24 family protein
MAEEPVSGSVTHWIGELKAGQGEAAEPLWSRYFERLVRLASAKLQRGRRLGGDADGEDAALSAFRSLCSGAARGRFPRLDDRDDLWRLLAVITLRKAQAQARRRRRWKRGGKWFHPGGASDGNEDLLRHAISQEPTPELAAEMADELGSLLGVLGDDQLRQIAMYRMEGYTVDEIAERLGCARRTVARRLELIRMEWLAERPG